MKKRATRGRVIPVIEYLISRKFPGSSAPPPPGSPQEDHQSWKQYQNEREAYRGTLLQLPPEEIQALARQEAERCSQQSESHRTRPTWTKWRILPSVTRWQAVALSLDIEPVTVERTDWHDNEDLAEIHAEFADRLFILRQMEGMQPATVSMADAAESHVRLRDFAEKALHIGWTIPDELSSLAFPQAKYASWTLRHTWTLMQTAHLLAGFEPDPHATPYILAGAAAEWYDRLKDAAISLHHLETIPSRSPELKGTHLVEHHKDVRVKPWRVAEWAREYEDTPDEVKQIMPPESVPSRAQLEARIAELEARTDGAHRWPWGDYTTTLLDHLAAAADQHWKRYDPTDPTTAPKNETVVTWLKERGVSNRVAEIMAQMLRADGLPSGPRR